MSIWCSYEPIGTEVRTRLDYDEHGAPILVKHGRQPKPVGGHVRSYASGWSNHYPTTNGKVEQPANVDIAHIPAWCVPGHREDFTDEALGPWLRLSIQTAEHDFYSGGKATGRYTSESVNLDEEAVRSLVAALSGWLERPKAHPVAAPVEV